MPLSEFDIIQRYFVPTTAMRADIILGIGDDAALIASPSDRQLVIAIDTLVANVHFPAVTDAYDIGWKALAVNLSDLAAMGADPAWFTLALTLPKADEIWLAAFARGLSDLAGEAGMQLVGGDTTRGPLTVTIQVGGHVPTNQALLRSGAQPGDEIWISGTPGDAALGLQSVQGRLEIDDANVIDYLRARLNRPRPRHRLGTALRGLATACIDVSDGLLADLGHLCEAGSCAATVHYDQLPLSDAARHAIHLDPGFAELPLVGGDDYELCFTAPPRQHASIAQLDSEEVAVTCIGHIESGSGVRCVDQAGSEWRVPNTGYQHFGDC